MPVYNYRYYDPNTHEPAPGGLVLQGPIVPIELHVPAPLAQVLTQQGTPLPSPVTGIGLIDTGATFSAIDNASATQLGLPPVRTVQVGTAAGQQSRPVYPVLLNFPTLQMDRFGTATGVDLTGQAVDGQPIIALIGRDFLLNCVLIYNGAIGTFTLCW